VALVVNSNSVSLNAQTNLNQTSRSLASSFSKLSSGLRITQAADDAAGLGVAENLASEAQSARQAMRNTNDGLSIIAVAEGATNEVSDIVKRMRELAVQSASETLHNNERAYLQDEFEQIDLEWQRISNVTEFNGISLFEETTGSPAPAVKTINVQVGVHDSVDDRIAINLGNLDQASIGAQVGILAPPSVDNVTNARTTITVMDDIGDLLNDYRSGYGAVQNRLESALNNMETYTQNLGASESRIRDADFAFETANMSKFQIMQQAGVAVLGQANGLAQGALRLI